MRLKSLPALLCALGASHAWSQTVPDAGQTMRELQRPAAAPAAKQAPQVSVTEQRPAMSAPDSATFPVTSFTVSGSQQFPAGQLSALLAPWAGRPLSMADLREAAARITRHYRDAGYLVARAYVPAQTMRDGVVDIAVLEGRLGNIELRNASRVSDDQARALLGGVRSGDAVAGPVLEQSLGRLNETPGIGRASAVLQPGASVGLSDLVVALAPGPLLSGALDADNYGNRYTGAVRIGSTINVNSPLHLGDQLSGRFMRSEDDLSYARLAYRAPVGSSGLVVGAALAASSYRLGQDFAPLDVTGDARVSSIFASYPLLRGAALNVGASLSADHKNLRDRVASVNIITDKAVDAFTAGVAGNGASGPLAYAMSAAYTRGELDIRSDVVRAADAASARSQGSYGKFAYAASARMRVAGPWSAFGSVNGQAASKNLDSSEKFSVGGPDGVRAYPQGEAPSDEGYLASAELRYDLQLSGLGAMQVASFVDHGSARINHTPFAASANRRTLSGAGIALHWNAPANMLVQLSVAWKLGNALPTSDSDRSARGWLQVSKFF